ncbi:hypothetical protein [Persephonella sp.]
MLFLGIHCNSDRTFTTAQMDKNRNILSISNFWKEGLLWFIDHVNPAIVAVNFSSWFDPVQTKSAYEVITKLTDIFGFEEAQEKINTEEKIVVKTDTDLFFKQVVRKELLPVDTREGIEQRIYNLPKAGIIVKPEFFSEDKNRLQREVLSIASSFTAYSIYHGQFTVEKREEESLFIPVYSYVPKGKRIIS